MVWVLLIALLCSFSPVYAHESRAHDSVSKAQKAKGDKLTVETLSSAIPLATRINVARERRNHLKGMMASDPAEVIRLTIPGHMRRALPRSIRNLVEQEVELDGDLEVLHVDYENGEGEYEFYLDTPHGRKQLRFAHEHPSHLKTGAQVKVKGVQIDNELAAFGEDVAERKPGTGGGGGTTSPPTSTFGPQKTLLFLVNFSDLATQPVSAQYAKDVVLGSLNTFNFNNSYGQTTIAGDVTGWHTIALSSKVCDYNTLASQAMTAAKAAGVNTGAYSRLIFGFPANACSWIGLGTVGGSPSKAWIRSFSLMAIAHEVGHNLGLYHSHSYDCGASVIGTNCTVGEYGDPFDMMGGGTTQDTHFNAYQKEHLGWLNHNVSPPITTVTTTGDYEIGPYEMTSAGPKALKILKGTDSSGRKTYYYVEWRPQIASTSGGVLLHQGTENNWGTSYLLDTTPETSSWGDAALLVGRTFHDAGIGLSITPTGITGGVATVNVAFGTTPPPPPPPTTEPPPPVPPTTDPGTCTRVQPTVQLSAPQWIKPGGMASYTVKVTNNDAAACPASNMSLMRIMPSYWTGNFASWSTGVLAPGASMQTIFSITAPTTVADAIYTFTIRAYDSNHSGSGIGQVGIDTTPPVVGAPCLEGPLPPGVTSTCVRPLPVLRTP